MVTKKVLRSVLGYTLVEALVVVMVVGFIVSGFASSLILSFSSTLDRKNLDSRSMEMARAESELLHSVARSVSLSLEDSGNVLVCHLEEGTHVSFGFVPLFVDAETGVKRGRFYISYPGVYYVYTDNLQFSPSSISPSPFSYHYLGGVTYNFSYESGHGVVPFHGYLTVNSNNL